MTDVEVHVDLAGETHRLGLLRRHTARRAETVTFEYGKTWFRNPRRFTERVLKDEETDDDLDFIFAPGSSLGGARPKAPVIDQQGYLSIATFPKETDDYSIETWVEPRVGRLTGTRSPPNRTSDGPERCRSSLQARV